jgi:hypothetical protein
MNTSESAAAFEAELRVVEEDLARLRETAADLRRRIGEREDEPTDPAERSALIEQAEEQEALIDILTARREELLRKLGRPGTGTGPVGRPLLSGPGVLDPDGGEWQGNVLQGLALGIDAPDRFDQPAYDHDAAADQVPDGEAGPVCAIITTARAGPARDGSRRCAPAASHARAALSHPGDMAPPRPG